MDGDLLHAEMDFRHKSSFENLKRVIDLLEPQERRNVLTYAVILLTCHRLRLPCPSPENWNKMPASILWAYYPVTMFICWVDGLGQK